MNESGPAGEASPNKEGGVGVRLLLSVWASDSLAMSTTHSHESNDVIQPTAPYRLE